jgi:hypothetical protein
MFKAVTRAAEASRFKGGEAWRYFRPRLEIGNARFTSCASVAIKIALVFGTPNVATEKTSYSGPGYITLTKAPRPRHVVFLAHHHSLSNVFKTDLFQPFGGLIVTAFQC